MPISDALASLCVRPIAHRGLHACGRDGPVENTIAAAEAAIAGNYGIECDVWLSRDGEIIVFHDEDLERLTGVSGRVDAQDKVELSTLRLRDGSSIPTLRAFLAAIDGRVPLVIELKSAGIGDLRLAERTLDVVADYRGPVALESFDPALVARCREAACPIGLVGPDKNGDFDPNALRRCDFLSWNIAHVSDIAARYPHLPRTAWTVRSPAQQIEAHSYGAQIVFECLRPQTIA